MKRERKEVFIKKNTHNHNWVIFEWVSKLHFILFVHLCISLFVYWEEKKKRQSRRGEKAAKAKQEKQEWEKRPFYLKKIRDSISISIKSITLKRKQMIRWHISNRCWFCELKTYRCNIRFVVCHGCYAFFDFDFVFFFISLSGGKCGIQ